MSADDSDSTDGQDPPARSSRPSGMPRRKRTSERDLEDSPKPLAAVSIAGPTARAPSRAIRLAFFAIWSVAVPLALSVLTIWIFSPAPGAATIGALESAISEQKIPFGIIFFTLFAFVLWRFRHDLPLAVQAGVGGRRDIPAKQRERYEEAALLLEEARRILRLRKREVARELVPSEREEVERSLEDLDRVMYASVFSGPSFDKAVGRAERAVGEHLSRWRKGEIREYAESIAIAVGVALLLRAFVAEAFKIPSGSMIPTLLVGDHIFVNKFIYGPQIPISDTRLLSNLPPERGEVIVFKFPENEEQDFIKRVVAVPGDTLEVIDGRPILNGVLVPNCYVGPYVEEGKPGDIYVEFLGEIAFLTHYNRKPGEATCETHGDCDGGRECIAGLCGRSEDHRGPWTVPAEEVWVMGDNRNNSHDSREWNGARGGGVPFSNIRGRAMVIFATFGQQTGVLDRVALPVMGKPQLPKSHARLQPALDKCLRDTPRPGKR